MLKRNDEGRRFFEGLDRFLAAAGGIPRRRLLKLPAASGLGGTFASKLFLVSLERSSAANIAKGVE